MFRLIPVLCALLLSAGVSRAQTNPPLVRVTAPRSVRVDPKIPADTTLISGTQIERSQSASVPELLAREANILFRSSTGKPSEGQIAMRGFGDNSGLRVLVEVDGHKFNRPDMGSPDWNQIPIGDVACIEVLRGGQTVLYGNHAMAGVVKITTRKGGEPRLYLRGVQGSYDFEQYSALATGGAGSWYADGGVDYLHDPGFRTNSLSWSKTAHASLGRFIGESGSLTLRASYGETYMQFPGPLTYEQMMENPRQSSNEGDQESRSTNSLYTLLWESDHAWGKTKLGAGYGVRDMNWSLSGIYAENEQQGLSLTPRIQFGPDKTFLILGADFFADQVVFDGYSGTATNRQLESQAKLKRITMGPYAFAQIELPKKLTLSGGARYETARTKNQYTDYDYLSISPPTIDHPIFGFPVPNPDYDSNATVRVVNSSNSFDGVVSKDGWAAELSLVWQPCENLSLWAGYDRSYRYPALDETASYQGYPLSDPLNEKLDPEEGDNFEAGIKYSDGRFLLSITGFYMELHDEIVFDNLTNLNVNIGPTTRCGAEVETGFSGKYAGVSTRCEFVEARFSSGENVGKTVPLVPWAHGTISAWIEPVNFLRLTTYYTHTAAQYQGNDYANEMERLKDYGLLGARIDLRLFDHATLFFKADNIMDQTYASSAYNGVYYPGAEKTFQVGFALEL